MRVLILFFFIANASAAMCDFFYQGATVGGLVTANFLQCENKEAVIRDHFKFFQYEEFCGDKGFVCATIADVSTQYIIRKIPKHWECKPVRAQKLTRAMAYRICSQYIPYIDHQDLEIERR